ncbi:alkaline phosphatase [Luteolibacter sp. AS25]|uniref:alkaline phosphatase n=1 Tax=Luteolibacter sp. AS25 TaxID=3135776 RepID=UPI00398AFEA3
MQPSSYGRRDILRIGSLLGTSAFLAGTSRAQEKSSEVNGIIFMVSDGMSPGVLSIAQNFSKIVRNRGTAWWDLIGNPASVQGLMETSSANSLVTDSSAASSAWGGGVKINNNSVNVRPDGSESEPIMRSLKKLGLRTGLVSTASITHATPAGFASVTENRDHEHLIAPQYLDTVDILLGGGLKFFDPKQRVDSRDALTPFQKKSYELVRDRNSLLKSKSERILGLFSNGHIPYEIDRLNDRSLQRTVPTLSEMSKAAVRNMLFSNQKFLLQIEGGRIDHGAHANDIAGLIWDQLAFDQALETVLEMTAGRDDILIIVTTDHGNGNPGLNGTGKHYANTSEAFRNITKMSASHERIFQKWRSAPSKDPESMANLIEVNLGFKLSPDEAEALTAAFRNPAGKKAARLATKGEKDTTGIVEQSFTEWSNQLRNPQGLLGQIAGNHTGIGWTGTSHTSDPAILTALGPQSQRFQGTMENQEIHRHLMELLS